LREIFHALYSSHGFGAVIWLQWASQDSAAWENFIGYGCGGTDWIEVDQNTVQ
jgi:hypothetical protein